MDDSFSARLLVRFVMRSATEDQAQSITVGIGGLLVSGFICNDQEWLDRQTGMSTPPMSDSGSEGGGYAPGTAARKALDMQKIMQFASDGMIMLREATIMRPDLKTIQVPFWYGRISSVDFWFESVLT